MSSKKLRSKLEKTFEDILKEYKVEYGYEITKIPYVIPESDHKYCVDWTLLNGLMIETKGWLQDSNERRKYLLIKEQHPDLDLRFVFANPQKLCGGTKMTHAQWADKNGFRWCSITDKEQILTWVKEKHENISNS